MNLRETIKKYRISVSMLATKAGISQQLLHFRFKQDSTLDMYPGTKDLVVAALNEMVDDLRRAVA